MRKCVSSGGTALAPCKGSLSGQRHFIILDLFIASLAPFTAGVIETCCAVIRAGSDREQARGGGSQGLLPSRWRLFPRVRIIPVWNVVVYSLSGADPGIGLFLSYHSQEGRGHGVWVFSEARTLGGGLGRARPCVWRGCPWRSSAAPESVAGPVSQSHPTSLALFLAATTALDSWGWSRERLQNKVPLPQLRESKGWPRSHSEV